jgi:multidrug transporter EmrE-like cation transporter
MAWAYLVLAGLFEIGWPIGLKFAQGANTGLRASCWPSSRWG